MVEHADGRGRLVEHVEMDPGHAGCDQLLDLPCGVGHTRLELGRLVIAGRFERPRK